MADPITLRSQDRGILVGTSGSGKSTLANHLVTSFRRDYPTARILVMDTKPRWRAERMADGTNARKLYKKMGPGDFIPGSVTMSHPREWGLAWDKDNNPTQTVVLQRIDGMHATNVAFQTDCAKRFFSELDIRIPAFIYYDEGHDFFTQSGSSYHADIIQRGYRAGRERGLTSLIGFQRPIGFNLQCLTETNYCALFYIKYRKDMKRLHEMGWPENIPPPTENEYDEHIFKVWRERQRNVPAYHLKLNTRRKAA